MMWNYDKVFFFLLLGVCFFWKNQVVNGQNLFDCQHSLLYADYLFVTKNYERAANEYERILYTCDTMLVHKKLLQAYRLSGRYQQSFRVLDRLYPTLLQAPDFAREEYLKLFLLTAQYSRVDSLLKTGLVSTSTERLFRLKANLLANSWKTVDYQLSQLDSIQLPNRSDYRQLLDKAQQFKPKKQWLAGALSGVVPGLGKIYTHNRKDGLIGFLFIGSLAYQAYRAFHRRGSDSVAGWIFTGVGIGFYVGNIYGSVKSARLLNQRQSQQLNNEAKRISFSDF